MPCVIMFSVCFCAVLLSLLVYIYKSISVLFHGRIAVIGRSGPADVTTHHCHLSLTLVAKHLAINTTAIFQTQSHTHIALLRLDYLFSSLCSALSLSLLLVLNLGLKAERNKKIYRERENTEPADHRFRFTGDPFSRVQAMNELSKQAMEVERKFVCSFPDCGKDFKRRDYLTRHESNHSDVRPFECKSCQKTFVRRDLLDKHNRSKAHLLEIANTESFPSSRSVSVTPMAPMVPMVPLTSTEGNGIKDTTINIGLPSKSQSHAQPHTQPHTQPPLKRMKNVIQLDLPPPGTDPFESESFESLMTSGRFSNVANGIEDSFGWLFGAAFPAEEVHEQTEDLNSQLGNQHEDLQLLDFGVNEETFIKMQRYIRNESKVNDSFITMESINTALSGYWQYFNPVYPIVHRPTFDPNAFEKNNLNIYFLLSVVTLGMASMDTRGEQYRVALLDIQRCLRAGLYALLDSAEYDPSSISLKLLQSVLLSDIFHLYYGDAAQHVKFRISHPVIINVLKEMKVFVNLTEPYVDPGNVDFLKWSKWIRYETLKRITFFAYILDTQGSFFLGTTPSISVFDVQMELPYTDSVWLAPNCMSFASEYRRLPRDLVARKDYSQQDVEQTRYQINKEDVMSNGNLIPNVKGESRWPNFLWSLRRLMQPFIDSQEREYHINCFSQYSRFVFLHGLLSLVRELRTRNIFMFDIKDNGDRLGAVAAKIEHAFFSWRSYFHSNITIANAASLSNGPELLLNSYDSSPSFWANITLLNAGLMGLYCDFGMIVQYSKTVLRSLNSELSNILINSPGKLRFDAIETTKNKILVLTWAKSKDGEHALVQSCLFLQTVLWNQDIVSKVPHAAYGLYLAALLCWAQHQGSELPSVGGIQGLMEGETIEFHKDNAFIFINSVLQKTPVITRLHLRSLMLYVVYVLQNGSDPDDTGLKELTVLADTI